MPGTASNNFSRSGPAARPSAKYRPAPAHAEIPVLLKLPMIESVSGGAVIASAAAKDRSVEHAEPSVGTAVDRPIQVALAASSSVSAPNPIDQTIVAAPPVVREAPQEKRSWWEHWSSGIVLFVLLLALLLAAMIAFNDSQNSQPSSLADDSIEQTKDKSNLAGSLADIEIPRVSLGSPVSNTNNSAADTASLALTPASSGAENKRPVSQVSVRTGNSVTNEPSDVQSESSNEQDSGVKVGGDVQLGLPTPLNDSSANVAPSESTSARNSLVLARPTEPTITNVASAAETKPSTQSTENDSILIPNDPAPSLLSLDNSSGTDFQSSHSQNQSLVPNEPTATAASNATADSLNSKSTSSANASPQTAEKLMASTKTPELETEQLAKMWLYFNEQRNSPVPSGVNRYQSSTLLTSQSPSPTQHSAASTISAPGGDSVSPVATQTNSNMNATTVGFQSSPAPPYVQSPNVQQPFMPPASVPSMTAGFQTQPSTAATPLTSPTTVQPPTHGTLSTMPYPGSTQPTPAGSGGAQFRTGISSGLIGSQGPSQIP